MVPGSVYQWILVPRARGLCMREASPGACRGHAHTVPMALRWVALLVMVCIQLMTWTVAP